MWRQRGSPPKPSSPLPPSWTPFPEQLQPKCLSRSSYSLLDLLEFHPFISIFTSLALSAGDSDFHPNSKLLFPCLGNRTRAVKGEWIFPLHAALFAQCQDGVAAQSTSVFAPPMVEHSHGGLCHERGVSGREANLVMLSGTLGQERGLATGPSCFHTGFLWRQENWQLVQVAFTLACVETRGFDSRSSLVSVPLGWNQIGEFFKLLRLEYASTLNFLPASIRGEKSCRNYSTVEVFYSAGIV
ncbi:hypothetical protein RRG08_063230 [Elysia crispata]|uniref:Uncharacterized protein n=1 Tax=Elysia crispata TaxID=231223 RepID=A0AAE1CUX4_9GAST|nr:hypothetical protein RRG08_063230 [Elysia crispata]